MKKKNFLFGALLLSSSLFAQDSPAVNNHFGYRPGVKIGLSFASIQVNGTNDPNQSTPDSHGGFIIGGFYRIPLNGKLAFQPEIQYINKGWEENTYHVRHNLNYFELPLNLLFTAYGVKGNSFYAGGGPAPAILMNERFDFGSNATPNQFDLGINLLVGYELPIGFSLNVNYTHGLLDINKTSNGPSIKNKCFGLTIGYAF